MTEQALEALLAERIGLDAASIGRDEIARALSRRMEATGVADPADYLAWARDDAGEWDELVEHVLVPETWCFREPAAFAVLADHVRQVLATRPRARLLSMPCATGEEPCSMAMAVLGAGIDGRRVEVLGVDVSARALAAARRGVYGVRALQAVPDDLRARFLEPDAAGARVTDEVRRMISFARGNLLRADAIAPARSFDVIFCRNVLIYLAEPARRTVVLSLARLLADDGLLVTGHAEGTRFVAPAFESCRLPGVLAYRKAGPGTHGALPSRDRDRIVRGGALQGRQDPGHQERERPPAPPAGTDGALPSRVGGGEVGRALPTLEEARVLADAGRLDEARAACALVLAARPADAEAHHLAGVIALARRDPAAAEVAFRRAVYLAPSHHEALLHLALVCDARGARAEAARLRRRASLGRDQGPNASRS